MPEFIESVYVHRPVREADIPKRGALSKRARGKSKRTKAAAAPTSTPTSTAATMSQATPSALWSMTARETMFRPVPPARKGRLAGADLTPVVTTLFFVWIAVCSVFKILG